MDQTETIALGVVVVTHNSAPWIAGFFDSWEAALRTAPALDALGVRVIVADSGSTDDTLQHLRQSAPPVPVVCCGNIGYGAAANCGAAALDRLGSPEWILLCNPDLTFDSSFAATLLKVIQAEKNVGCIGPRLLNGDQSMQPSAGRFPSLPGLLIDRLRRRDLRKYRWRQPGARTMVDWVSGACLLMPRKAFTEVGGFDDHFFLYVEEVDLQRRLKDAGYSTIFEPALRVTHHAPNAMGAVRPAVQRWAALGLLRYFAKHKSWLALRAYGMLAVLAGRLGMREALAARRTILRRRTGD